MVVVNDSLLDTHQSISLSSSWNCTRSFCCTVTSLTFVSLVFMNSETCESEVTQKALAGILICWS